MASSLFSVSGLSSGLDTETIISQLMSIEQRSVTLLETKQSTYQSQMDVFSSINTKLATLKSHADSLKESSTFQVKASSSSDEAVVTAAATSSASIGTYSINVTNLASAHKVSSDTFADTTTALGFSGDIIINGKRIAIGASDSLNTVKSSINSANAGVTATILRVSSTDHRLVITSKATGTENNIDLIDSNTSNVLQSLGLLNSGVTTQNNSDPFTSDTTAVGTLRGLSETLSGTIQINGTDVSIDLSNDSLQDIATAINTAGAGTTASVTSESVDGTTMYKIALTGTNTYTDSNNILETLGFVNGVAKNELQAAGDATLILDNNINVTRSSNTITDLVEGMTFYLTDEGTADITVTNDSAGVKTSINDFVTAYNDLISEIGDQFRFDEDEDTPGVLMGDFTLRLIRSNIRNITTSQVQGLSGDISFLSQIGITTDESDGTLVVDETKLDTALANPESLSDVEAFFAAMGSQLSDKLNAFTDSTAGLLTSRTNSIQGTIDNLDDKIEGMEKRLAVREERLRDQFVTLEVLLSQMQTQSTAFTQLLAGLPKK